MFINAEHPRGKGINIRQRQRRGVQSPLDQPLRDTERRGGPAGTDDGSHQGFTEPVGGPCMAGDLGCFLGKCLARAQVLSAEESPLGPDHFDRPGDRDMMQAL